MCDICVMNSVKRQMLSRRDLFRVTAAGAAVAAAGTLSGTALAKGHDQIVDMTHEFHEDFPTYLGTQPLFRDQKFNIGDHGFNLYEYRVNEHAGTHIDAPLHFSGDGQSVSEIPVSSLVAPLCVIDLRAKAADDADAQLTPDDVSAWVAANGDIPENACVAMNSGWAPKLGGDGYRNADSEGKQHYPGFHPETAQMLIEETGANSIAVDTLSLDYGMSGDFGTHYTWLPSGRFGIENIANLDAVPASGATLFIGAPKYRGGTGGQARIIAMI